MASGRTSQGCRGLWVLNGTCISGFSLNRALSVHRCFVMAGQRGLQVIPDEAFSVHWAVFFGSAHLRGACNLFSGSDSPDGLGESRTASQTEEPRGVHARNTQGVFGLFRRRRQMTPFGPGRTPDNVEGQLVRFRYASENFSKLVHLT